MAAGAAAGEAGAGAAAADTSVGASLATEGGASGFAAGGASSFGANLSESSGSAFSGQAGAAGGATGQFMEGLKSFFQNPDNLKTIGKLLTQGGGMQATMKNAPDSTKQDFQKLSKHVAAMQNELMAAPQGAPSIGSISPTPGPYTGDISQYVTNPQFAQDVLSRMGISFGQG